MGKNLSKEKVIFHMDGDAFFVACEAVKNPSLKGLPVVTGEERGIVSALSYEAKALGIKRGMPIFSIRKNFPSVIVLPGDYKTYVDFSGKMFDIVKKYLDPVEEYSIDECFADMTGWDKPFNLKYADLAEKIRVEIKDSLKLSVSVGLAPTKVLSKLASKWHKPDGFTVIDKKNISEFLKETKIEKVWGIGKRTSLFLNMKGIKTAYDFVSRDLSWVKENLSVPYETIWQELRGFSVLKVSSGSNRKFSSMQRTRTFYPATREREFLLSQLSKNTEEVCYRARYLNLFPKSLVFFLKRKDFKYIDFNINLPVSTNSPEIIFSIIESKFDEIYDSTFFYRSSGVILSDLSSYSKKQKSLFEEDKIAEKFENIHSNVDLLEKKMGKRLVYLGSTHKARKFKIKGTDSDDLSRSLLFL